MTEAVTKSGNFNTDIAKMQEDTLVTGMTFALSHKPDIVCGEPCLAGKMHSILELITWDSGDVSNGIGSDWGEQGDSELDVLQVSSNWGSPS